MPSFGDKLKTIRTNRDMTQEEFANLLHTTKQVISRYENEQRTPKISVAQEYAKILKVSLESLIDDTQFITSIPSGFQPLPKMKQVPRLGRISCGVPIMSEENLDGFDNVPENICCDFTLVCEGDSMINARIKDGDVVYIKQQPVVDNGAIAAVLIDGTEKLLKRVYITDTNVTLQAENPNYAPLVFVGNEMNRVTIIGKAVGFYSNIKS